MSAQEGVEFLRCGLSSLTTVPGRFSLFLFSLAGGPGDVALIPAPTSSPKTHAQEWRARRPREHVVLTLKLGKVCSVLRGGPAPSGRWLLCRCHSERPPPSWLGLPSRLRVRVPNPGGTDALARRRGSRLPAFRGRVRWGSAAR